MEAEWKHASILIARTPQGSGAHEWRVSIDTQYCRLSYMIVERVDLVDNPRDVDRTRKLIKRPDRESRGEVHGRGPRGSF